MYRNIWLPAVGFYNARSNNNIIQLSNHMNVKKGKLFDYIESLFENIGTLKMLAFGSSLFLIA